MINSVNRDALWKILGLSGVPPKLINLMSELYCGTESAMRCDDTISDLFPVVTGVCHGVSNGPHTFQRLYGLDFEEDVREIKLRCIFVNVKSSDVYFAVDAVIFAETLDILLGVLEVLNEESELMGLRVSWFKTTLQAFNDILDAAILSVPGCWEDVEVTERFTYLGSDIQVFAGCEPEFNRCLGRAWGVVDSWIMGCGAADTGERG